MKYEVRKSVINNFLKSKDGAIAYDSDYIHCTIVLPINEQYKLLFKATTLKHGVPDDTDEFTDYAIEVNPIVVDIVEVGDTGWVFEQCKVSQKIYEKALLLSGEMECISRFKG